LPLAFEQIGGGYERQANDKNILLSETYLYFLMVGGNISARTLTP